MVLAVDVVQDKNSKTNISNKKAPSYGAFIRLDCIMFSSLFFSSYLGVVASSCVLITCATVEPKR
jgi:hypothetical protein